jgi:hypothetical protein
MLVSFRVPAMNLAVAVQTEIQGAGDLRNDHLPVDESHVRDAGGPGHMYVHLCAHACFLSRIRRIRTVTTRLKPLFDPANIDSSATTNTDRWDFTALDQLQAQSVR